MLGLGLGLGVELERRSTRGKHGWGGAALALALGALLGFVGMTAALALPVAPPEDWHVTADVAESCSCAISCPCNFGSHPTHDYCYGNRLYQITRGHYRDTDVSGLELMVTFSMNEWAKLYVSDRVSDAQMKALEKLVPHFLGGFQRSGILSTQKVPLAVERSEGKLKFRVPDSEVDMDVMTGYDGKPVTIENLPSPTYQHYTQYKSVVTRHRGGDREFEYSGTTGFTSKLDVGGAEKEN
jgi:hypothetical protein